MSDRVLGGRYTVQDKIGAGGMAVVYRGLDEVLGRTVAIKTMLPQYAGDASFAARFKQEAQAAAALQSPYIVSVYDWGRDGDTYYIVMEYLRGTDLKSGIRRHGALDGKKVAQVGSQIAQALSVAHRHDIIHRDIKPQNIMVQPDGNIKVMDFGIARAKNSHLTTDNSVLGTAHYVSPEQTQGKELGPTTDIYSLGIVMYEAATGKVPFDGDDAISVALKQVNEQPKPPSQLNPSVDSALEGIILKCMQKDPEARFQTADELYHVLRDYLAGRMQAVSSATATTAIPTTPVMAPLQPVNSTQSIPRIQANGHGRPRSATEQAREKAQREAHGRRRKLVLGTVFVTLALIAAIVAIASLLTNRNATASVPNLSNLTEEQALATIDASVFERGTVKESYSSTVASGLVMDQSPDAGLEKARGTQISIVISKGPEPAADVVVPDLKNLSPSEAEQALAKANLVGQAGDSVYSSEVEVGKVAQQSIAANSTAKAGDTVTYQLSKGVETAEVPDVTGYSEESARNTLQNSGFGVSVQRSSSNSVEEGEVISQSPTGTAEKGGTITITVSTGPADKNIPSVVGYSEDGAQSALDNAGFLVNTTYATSPSVPRGNVISQSPTGSAKAGSTVTIVVSTGSGSGTNGAGEADGGSSGKSSGTSSSTETR